MNQIIAYCYTKRLAIFQIVFLETNHASLSKERRKAVFDFIRTATGAGEKGPGTLRQEVTGHYLHSESGAHLGTEVRLPTSPQIPFSFPWPSYRWPIAVFWAFWTWREFLWPPNSRGFNRKSIIMCFWASYVSLSISVLWKYELDFVASSTDC